MNSIRVHSNGMLELGGTPMPRVMVVGTSASGGKATLDSQQHEGGTGAEHVFDGWEDWTLKLRLEITEPRDGGTGRYADLAVIRQAQRALDGELPAAYHLTGPLPEALGVSRVLITAIDELDDDSEEDSLWLTVTLLETDPPDHAIQQQAAERAAAPPPEPATVPVPPPADLSADRGLLAEVLGEEWGGE